MPMDSLIVTSRAFHDGMIPDFYAKKGGDHSPPISISGVDERAKTFAIIALDPDIPIPFMTFTHWVVYNIPADVAEIPENVPHGGTIPSLGNAMQGRNGMGGMGYMGPNPPFGTHTYRFLVYALDEFLDLKAGASRKRLEQAMKGHVLQTGILTGSYSAKTT
jgi:Raf kinase inhibitor-like YbhB/YbcL family protein